MSGGGREGSSWKPPPGGPGKWVRKNEGMPAHSRRYQTQVTSAPEGWVYRVERGGEKFDFDGYSEAEGFLIDAKGRGYNDKFLDTLEPKPWFRNTGAREILKNADRQLRVANGVPIRWYVAEAKAARPLQRFLLENEFGAIKVIHVPAVP